MFKLLKGTRDLKKEIRQLKKQLAVSEKDRKKLQLVAEYDFLTGVYNRHGFVREAERFLHEMKSERQQIGKSRTPIVSNVSILFIDVDDLKYINDTFGHGEGDQYLRLIGQTVSNAVRAIDVVGRWGGDEFAVALINTNNEDAYAVAQKLKGLINHIKLSKQVKDFVCSVSIGLISVNGAHRQHINYDLHTLIEHADKAMYDAKSRKEKGVIVSFTDEV